MRDSFYFTHVHLTMDPFTNVNPKYLKDFLFDKSKFQTLLTYWVKSKFQNITQTDIFFVNRFVPCDWFPEKYIVDIENANPLDTIKITPFLFMIWELASEEKFAELYFSSFNAKIYGKKYPIYEQTEKVGDFKGRGSERSEDFKDFKEIANISYNEDMIPVKDFASVEKLIVYKNMSDSKTKSYDYKKMPARLLTSYNNLSNYNNMYNDFRTTINYIFSISSTDKKTAEKKKVFLNYFTKYVVWEANTYELSKRYLSAVKKGINAKIEKVHPDIKSMIFHLHIKDDKVDTVAYEKILGKYENIIVEKINILLELSKLCDKIIANSFIYEIHLKIYYAVCPKVPSTIKKFSESPHFATILNDGKKSRMMIHATYMRILQKHFTSEQANIILKYCGVIDVCSY